MGGFWKRYREVLTYLVSGFASMFISWGTYAVCKLFLDVSDPPQMNVAVVLRFLAGAGSAYVMNRVMVFRSRERNVLGELSKFFAGRLSTLAMDLFIMWLLPSVLGINDWIATFASQAVVTVANYVIGKFFVFRRKGNGTDGEL